MSILESGPRGRLLAALSPRAILRESSRLTGVRVASLLATFGLNLYVARELGPATYGLVGIVTIWYLYVGIARPGAVLAAVREVPLLLAQGNESESRKLQNTGASVELIYLSAASLCMVLAGILAGPTPLGAVLLVAAPTAFVLHARQILEQIYTAREKFVALRRAIALGALGSVAFVLATIADLGVFAAVLFPGVNALFIAMGLRFWGGPIGFRPNLSFAVVRHLMRAGIPLALGTIAFWGFRTADRVVVAGLLSPEQVGIQAFVLQFILTAFVFVNDAFVVIQPRLYAALGVHGPTEGLATHLRRLVILLLLPACAAVNVGQAAFGAFVLAVAPAFSDGVAVFEVYAFLLVVGTVHNLPQYMLQSSTINRVGLTTVLWTAGLVACLAVVTLLVMAGAGLAGAAFGAVLAQLGVTAAVFIVARKILLPTGDKRRGFVLTLLALPLLTVACYLVMTSVVPFDPADSTRSTLLRLGVVAATWGAAAGIVLPRWLVREAHGSRSPIPRSEQG